MVAFEEETTSESSLIRDVYYTLNLANFITNRTNILKVEFEENFIL
jgi:hypothetical protein